MNNLTLSNVSYEVNSNSLFNISFELKEGESLAVIGSLESGKNILGEIIAGIIKPTEGLVKMFDEEISAVTKQAFGYVYDGFPFSNSLNISDIDKIFTSIYERWNSKTFNGCCYNFSIPKKKPIKEFSPIVKRKLLLAIAFSHATRLLVMNDAFSSISGGMDEDVVDVLKNFLTKNSLRSLIITTEHIGEVKSFIDNYMFLDKGRCVLHVTKKELENEYLLIDCLHNDKEIIDNASMIFSSDNKDYKKVLVLNKYAKGKGNSSVPTINDLEKLIGECI